MFCVFSSVTHLTFGHCFNQKIYIHPNIEELIYPNCNIKDVKNIKSLKYFKNKDICYDFRDFDDIKLIQ